MPSAIATAYSDAKIGGVFRKMGSRVSSFIHHTKSLRFPVPVFQLNTLSITPDQNALEPRARRTKSVPFETKLLTLTLALSCSCCCRCRCCCLPEEVDALLRHLEVLLRGAVGAAAGDLLLGLGHVRHLLLVAEDLLVLDDGERRQHL